MSTHDGGKPPTAWLEQLREARHWDRLIAMAGKSLEIDPNDPATHRHIAWAYAASNRAAKMWPHVEFLLAREANDESSHHLAAVYYLETERIKQAWPHLQALMIQNPNSATYHYLTCIYALRTNDVRRARHHIARARSLAPDWVPAVHLEIRMDGIHRRKASDAWAQFRRLEETLSLDPRNARVITTIGEIFLRELERPRDAEKCFREALLIEPADKDRQEHLMDAIRARSLLYRTLSLPYRSARRAVKGVREKRIQAALLVLAIKFWLAFTVWVLVMGVFLTPAAWIYEWLILTEVPRARPLPRWLAPLGATLGWRLWLRMCICFVLIIGLWLAFFVEVCHAPLSTALTLIGVLFGVHFAFVAMFVGIRRVRARFGEWQHGRKQKKETCVVAEATVV